MGGCCAEIRVREAFKAVLKHAPEGLSIGEDGSEFSFWPGGLFG